MAKAIEVETAVCSDEAQAALALLAGVPDLLDLVMVLTVLHRDFFVVDS